MPGFSRDLPAAATARPGSEAYDLLFVGNDNHFNITGLLAFLDQEKALLEGRRLAVAGRVCFDERVRAAAEGRPNISLLGFVDDLAETYGASKLAISPVEGTGLKIKAVEALAHGKPVFGSPHTLAGLPPGYGDCVFLFDREAMAAMLGRSGPAGKGQRAAAGLYSGTLAEAGDLDRFRRLCRSPDRGPLGLRHRLSHQVVAEQDAVHLDQHREMPVIVRHEGAEGEAGAFGQNCSDSMKSGWRS